MRKQCLAFLMVLLLGAAGYFPLWGTAYANPLLDQALAGLVQGNSGASPLQNVIRTGMGADPQTKAAIVALLARAAETQLDRSAVTSLLAQAVNAGPDIEQRLKQEALARLSEKIGASGQSLSLIEQLLGGGVNLTPQTLSASNAVTGVPEKYRQVLSMTATAYGPGVLDNGRWNDATYMGGRVQKGVAAVDPALIPMGSRLWVEGYGEAMAVDQGSAIRGNRIDLAFNDRQEALDYGIKPVKVYVLN